MTKAYESMYIVRPQLEDEQVDAAMKQVEDLLAKFGGVLVRHEKKGKRRLAYEVKDQREGTYCLINFEAGQLVLDELRRFFSISDDILRSMILTQEEAGPIQTKAAPAPVEA
ncbi:MAG: 30S ribosomal protein S6 [Candidatus Sericytochromatia bacterium]|nr:30S ribosomal protein S6 [Candidatus Sericytochromatia bacterium]